MTARRRALAGLAALLLVLGFGIPAHAALVLDFMGGAAGFDVADDLTVGWEFTVTTPIVIGGLGVWDEGADGLLNSHTVGLWTGDGLTLLASTLVTNASSTPAPSTSPDGQWLFNAISSVALSPGTYVIGTTYVPEDPDIRLLATATTIPEVTFVQSRLSLIGSGFTFPAVPGPIFNDGIFGPNLRTVPAPLTGVLLVLGLVGIAAHRLVRRRDR